MSLARALRHLPIRRPVLSTRLHRSAGHDHHAPQWNEPSGYLFNEKPLAPGAKRVKEGWEDIWYWGMGVAGLVGALYGYYKPDTSIVTWAREEAEKSLQEKGVSLEYPRNTPPSISS